MDRLGRSWGKAEDGLETGAGRRGLEGSGPEAKNQFKARPQVRKARTWAVLGLAASIPIRKAPRADSEQVLEAESETTSKKGANL